MSLTDDGNLMVWTIYDHPTDYPDKWVARPFVVMGSVGATPSAIVFTADTLDEIRSMLPPGLICLSRHQDDDKVIYEVWV